MIVRTAGRQAAAFLFALLAAGTARGAEPLSVRPSETDHRITIFDSPHLAWLPDGAAARNQLLVFLPGTGGTPGKADLPHSFADHDVWKYMLTEPVD